MSLKWGIAGTGKISHDFVTGLSTCPENEQKIIAVGARNIEDAKKFANTHSITQTYAGYNALAKDPNVEIVYVGVINRYHYDVSMLMLEHGKHVLCETAFCLNEKQAKKLFDFAKANKLFIMEGIWSRFLPSYLYIREQINTGALGRIEKVIVEFGFQHFPIDCEKIMKSELGGGSLLDIGIYAIQLCQFVFEEEPCKIEATGELNSDGADMRINAKLTYENGGIAEFKTSVLDVYANEAVIIGTKGQITMKNFWCCDSIIDVDGDQRDWSFPKGNFEYNYPNAGGFSYEVTGIRQSIRNGQLENDHVTHNESLIIARIEDEIRRQIGVKFTADDD